jgi:protein-L-isoaspartate(D-aspartate) O-methyltransferase
VIVGLRPGLFILALSLLAVSSAAPAATADVPLDQWLSTRGIRDPRVLAAFAAVPRDVFIAQDGPDGAFDGKPPPAASGQIITQPYLTARMLEELQLRPEARVLEVGTGTGYTAALLGRVASEVFSVGVIPELATTARLRLTGEGYQNVHVKLGDTALGWREYSPYDAVVVTTVGSRVPPALIEQLSEGGVLVMVVGPPRGRQVLIRGVKKGFKLHAKEVVELRAAGSEPRRDGGQRGRADDAPRSRDRGDDVRDGRPRSSTETETGR